MKKVDLSNITKPSNISDELKDKFDKVQFKVRDPLKELQRNQELSARGNLSARGVKGKQAKSDIIKGRQGELRQQFYKDNAGYDFDLRLDPDSPTELKQIYRNRLKKLVTKLLKILSYLNLVNVKYLRLLIT